mmetsp:Transcript_22031/g.71243  ORF Transcript_22031/g.71243 Transcript_22031/m.71243 type:complete len:166 (-) Transcript_22031:92-589(-)
MDVSKLKIVAGVITKVWPHPDAEALWCEKIDVGEGAGKERQVVSGVRHQIPEDQMMGARVCVLVNVKPGALRGEPSEGLVLVATGPDGESKALVNPPEGVPPGEQVKFAGFEGEPEAVLVPKKKQFEKLQPMLKTNADAVACFGDVPFMTSKGPCTAAIANATVK